MRFERLDLNLLVALDLLLEECNVSAAARRLNLSQSATSGALLRLREYFADEILVNVGSRMVPTARAEELREPVREALMFIRHRIATPPAFDPSTAERVLKIATSDYILDVALGPFMKLLQERAPGIAIQMILPTLDMSDQLNRSEIDLIVSVGKLLDDRHPKLELFSDDHVVVAWEGNSSIRGGMDAETFYSLQHIAVYFGSTRTTAHVERFFDDQQIERNVAITVPYFSAVPPLLLGTNRIATMMRRQAEHYAKLLPLKIFDAPFPIPDLGEVVQYHRARTDDPCLAWFIREFVAFAAPGPD